MVLEVSSTTPTRSPALADASYPKRLAGLNLDSGKVRWYALNTQGEIETLR